MTAPQPWTCPACGTTTDSPYWRARCVDEHLPAEYRDPEPDPD